MKRLCSLIILLLLLVQTVIAQDSTDEPSGFIVYAKEVDLGGLFNYEDLYLLNLSTGEEIQLTDTPEESEDSPTWSPDGELILFHATTRFDGLELFTIRPDGTDLTQLTDNSDSMTMPAWSPDGSQIAYVLGSRGTWSLHTMDSDANNQRPILRREEFPADPDWDPLGEFMVISLRQGVGASDIMLVDVVEDRLLNISRGAGIEGEYAFSPDWSNDGTLITFTHRSDRDDDLDIYTMTPLGNDLTLLTDNTDSDSSPTWSPDDEWIAFVSDRDGQRDIYIMRADGSDVQRVTNTPEAESDLAWQPFVD